MDAFAIRERLVGDYADYVRSFVTVRDDRMRTYVDEVLDGGTLWPQPLIQLNPAFEAGEALQALVADGVLHAGCEQVFRIKSDADPVGVPIQLHRHQTEAIRTAASGRNYVLTTGTGSGKSLAYIVPIVNAVLQAGSGKGIKAIVVYPMNALANSQLKELEKFLKFGFPAGGEPVRYARYTGQEDDEQRKALMMSPPDILLTNYVMLELILTRPRDTSGSSSSTSCTRTAGGREPTWRCWCAGSATSCQRGICSASAPRRHWPPVAASTSSGARWRR